MSCSLCQLGVDGTLELPGPLATAPSLAIEIAHEDGYVFGVLRAGIEGRQTGTVIVPCAGRVQLPLPCIEKLDISPPSEVALLDMHDHWQLWEAVAFMAHQDTAMSVATAELIESLEGRSSTSIKSGASRCRA